jgi:Caudovirus prohead serine protease
VPYLLQQDGDRWCVHYKRQNGEAGEKVQGGCHDTRAEALRHLRALYVNVPDAWHRYPDKGESAMPVNRFGGLEHGLVAKAELGADGLVRGTASTYGNADRMDRVLLPGAFGRVGTQLKVPFLLNHKDDTPLGESTFTVTRDGLAHQTDIVGEPVQPGTGVPIRDLLRKGYPATSIGWLPKKAHYGWRNFAKAEPEAAQQAAAMGVVQDEHLRYFAEVEVVENSLVPIPANPRALLEAASLLAQESPARAELEAMVEIAAGARHSQSDSQAIQRAHDALVEAGAACTPEPGRAMPGTPEKGPGTDMPPSDSGIKGGWHNHMHSSYDEVLRVLQEHEVADSEFIAARLVELEEQAVNLPESGYRERDGKRVFDPDNDGDDDSSPEGDTDHSHWTADGKMTPLGLKTFGSQKSAAMSTGAINDLPDSDFAYIEPGGKKDESGKTTPRSLRHFPIHDEAHVRNALSRAPQSPFGEKAMPKIRAAARKFGIEVSDEKSNFRSSSDFVELEATFMAALGAAEREIGDLPVE